MKTQYFAQTRAILQYFLGISFDNSNSMEKMPMTNPINWNTDLPWALLPVVKILARLVEEKTTGFYCDKKVGHYTEGYTTEQIDAILARRDNELKRRLREDGYF